MSRVLLVDAVPSWSPTLVQVLLAANHETSVFSSPEAAQVALEATPFDVLVVELPLRPALDLLGWCRRRLLPARMVLLLADSCVDDVLEAFREGVADVFPLPYRLHALHKAVEGAATNAQALRAEQATLDEGLHALAVTMQSRDPLIATHQHHVAALSLLFAERMGLHEDAVRSLRIAALLHDVGMLCVTAETLARTVPFGPVERNMVKLHVDVGFHLLHAMRVPPQVPLIVRQHHERLDGSGYPRALQGSDILVEARILAVADVLDAMLSDRPHRSRHGWEEALAEISRGRGTLYDPDVADACAAVFDAKLLAAAS